jgi:uncharacterized membrane protein YfcA
MVSFIVAFLGGLAAAFFGSMAGGGAGFLALYPLLFLGLPLNIAIATNNFGGIGFLPPSIRNFARKGLVKKKIFVPLLVFEGIGAILGTFLLIRLSAAMIKYAVTIVMIPAFLLLAFQPVEASSTKVSRLWRHAYLFYAVYAGLVGAGAGSIRTFVLIRLRKLPPLQAIANGFTATLPFTLISVSILLWAGLVNFQLGLFLFAGNLIGAHFGSKVAIKKGNEFARRMLLCLMAVTLVVIWVR